MPSVDVKPWVVADLTRTLPSRLVLGSVLFDLHNHLPAALARYQSRRIAASPRCFWYDRIYLDAGKLRGLHFVVRDADPAVLEVLWVLITE